MRILSLDLGGHSIRAIELDSAFGRFEVHEYHNLKVEGEQTPAEVLRHFMGTLSKKPDRIVASLKTGAVTFRNFQFPTKDKRQINASVGFEIEDELPFELDEMIYDYSVLSQVGNQSHVHAESSIQKNIAPLLSILQDAGIEPDVLTSETWAIRTLFSKILSPTVQEKPSLLLHLGHSRSVLYIHWRGFPVVAREILWGGRDLTLALCQKYSVPLEDAEKAKLENGFVLPESARAGATQEQQEFSDTLTAALEPLFKSVRQVQLTCKNSTQLPLAQVYLSGGTALLPGLGKLLEEELKIPVHALRALPAISDPSIQYTDAVATGYTIPVGLCLTQVGSERSLCINLRKGVFAKPGSEGQINFKTLKKPLLAAATVILCFFSSIGIQTSIYKGRLKSADEQLERTIKGYFGTVSATAMRTYLASPSTLKSSMNKELSKQRELAKLFSANTRSPLSFLKETSKAITPDTVVDLMQFQVGAAAVSKPYQMGEESMTSLSFLVANQQVAEKLSQVLTSRIDGMQKSKIEEFTTPAGQKKYKITLSGKPKDEAFGDR